uniref:Uncharacterized protein n=1 Tax=Aegilops tauschii subsp. strangulata TaxID=200361 RepID=A0A453KXV5_AEGTS
METTASWRLLPAASSPRPSLLQARRQATFPSSLQQPAISKSRILCLLHDKVSANHSFTHMYFRVVASDPPSFLIACVACPYRPELAAAEAGLRVAVRRRLGSSAGPGCSGDGERGGGPRPPGDPAAGGRDRLRLPLRCSPDYHELDEAEVVQAQVRRDVPAVHVHLPLLPRFDAVGTVRQFQKVPKG